MQGGGVRAITLSLDELWCLHKFLRRSRDQEGQEYDKGFMFQVYQGISHISHLPREKVPDATWEVTCDEGDLWQITRVVDMDYSRGGKYVGFNVLTKAILGLAYDEPKDALTLEIEEVLDHANGKQERDANPGQNSNAEDRP